MEITVLAVFLQGKKLLLEKRRKDEDNYAGMWALPGGHKRKKETFTHALKREMREEVAILIKKARYIGTFRDIDPTSKKQYSHHAFLCTEWHDHITHTTEQEKVKWVDLNQYKKLKPARKIDKQILKKAKIL
jgi:ADP-ribose pyrophosphatase YjhB (NUDIX family)